MMLYIVATPIGNLKDISLRALEVLKSVDLIACEDTRHTKILLNHYSINTPTTSFFQHNRLIKAEYIINLLTQGKSVALVSDAGMPGILDPGYNLINLAIKHNVGITVIPGACAFITALVLSGRPTHRFIFEGFLPNRQLSRRNRLRDLAGQRCTIVFYESCHRIIAALEDVQFTFGDKEICLSRELTKKFEEIKRDKPSRLIQSFKDTPPRGEFVVII